MTLSLPFVALVAVFVVVTIWAVIQQLRSVVVATADARRRRATEATTRVLIDVLVNGGDLVGADLPSAGSAELASPIARVAAEIEGRELDHLRSIAADLGMIDWAGERLGSPKWWERLRAISLLEALALPHDAQLSALDDTHPTVRAKGIRWMARTGVTVEGANRMLGALVASDGTVRTAALDTLAAGGDRARSVLVRILEEESTDDEVTASVLDIAAATCDPELVRAAKRWCRAPTPSVRASAAGAIAHSTGDRSLLALIDDPDPVVRQAAIRAVGRGRHKRLAGPVGGRLGDEDWRVRDAAIGALRLLGSPGQIVLRRHGQPDLQATAS